MAASLPLFIGPDTARAESRTVYAVDHCYTSLTTQARENPDPNLYMYEAEAQSFSLFHNARGACYPQHVIWYMYVETRGWNNDLGWHIVEYDRQWSYSYLCCSYLGTAWVAACGDYVCDRAQWHMTTLHAYRETDVGPYTFVYTSNDGNHSSYSCFTFGCSQ